MKTKIVLLLAIAFVCVIQSKGQVMQRTVIEPPKAAPIIKSEITKIELVVDSVVRRGNAPVVYFRATVYSVGKGTVQFQWVMLQDQHPGVPAPTPLYINESFVLNGTGVDEVHHSTVAQPNHATLAMKTITPNVVTSNATPY